MQYIEDFAYLKLGINEDIIVYNIDLIKSKAVKEYVFKVKTALFKF